MTTIRGVLYRRSTALAAHWIGSDLVVRNYVIASETPLPLQVAEILMTFTEPQSMPALLKTFRPLGHANVLVPFLIKQGVFVKIGSALDRKEKAIESHWERWSPSASQFYFSTSNSRFRSWVGETDEEEWKNREDPPSPFLDRKGRSVPLPPFSDDSDDRFFQVLAQRRTLRRCTGESIPLEAFSRVLRWTWGATHVIDSPVMRRFLLKTSPSGGGRHPTEVYAAIMRVSSLEPGIYHYSVRRDELTLLKEGNFEDDIVRVSCQGDFPRGAAAMFFMTSIVARSMWKYPISHALRVLLLDAGHLGQTFHLVCTALGLAPFSFAAHDTRGVEKLLAIDGVREIPLYTCAMGVPAARDESRGDRLGPEVADRTAVS